MKTIAAKAKAFSGEGIREHTFTVDSGTVRVYDPIAKYFTTVHALSMKAQRRIRKLVSQA